MRFSLIILIFIVSIISQASAAQLATVLGSPDPTVHFVQAMVRERVLIDDRNLEMNWTTQLYSILAENGVRKSYSIEVIGSNGELTSEDLFQGLNHAAFKAKIVYSAFITPMKEDGRICEFVARLSNTAFIFAAGKSDSENRVRNENGYTCSSLNILRVAALNENLDDLRYESAFGPSVRVAAPGTNISVIGMGGKRGTLSGTSAASAFVAAKIAAFSDQNNSLYGSELIARFLKEKTFILPSLQDKVREGRIIIQ